MNRRTSFALIAAAVMTWWLAVSPTDAALLAVQQASGTAGANIYSIDTGTGTQSLIGNSGIAQVQSLALSPDGTYYASTLTGNNLVTINPATGAGTVVAPITTSVPGGINFLPGLAFSPNGTLYGVAQPVGTGVQISSLYTIDKTTGVATFVGSTNTLAVQDIAFSPGGTLYGFSGQGDAATRGLRQIDLTTGNATFVGPAGGSTIGVMQALTFTPDGTLWASGQGLQMFTLDPATGDSTLKFAVNSYRGIAPLAPVPVPAAVWLFGSGLAAMVGVARRKPAVA